MRAGEFELSLDLMQFWIDYFTNPAVSTSFLKYQDSEYDADWILEMYNKGAAELILKRERDLF